MLSAVFIAGISIPSNAGNREIGGYPAQAESRFVRNVWNFIKEFSSWETVGSHNYKYSQYYWAERFLFEGSHASYVDKMDFVFISGHGNFYIWQPVQTPSEITNFSTVPAYGDLVNGGDLEFLVIESCNTVTVSPDDANYRNSWSSTFQGLHQLVGFRTLSVSDNGIPNRYARKLKSNQGIWQAWFDAVNDERSWWHSDLSDGSAYPGYASAVVYSSTDNDKLGSYAADPAGGTSGMYSWWQY
ncbi:MAG: hypothetical protein COA38_11610 [Fluviicola sp.]|nr:MAG: hypothetical protein COA38_11610 [Fluviicola sp.]